MSQAGRYQTAITPPIPGIVSTLTGNDAVVVGPNGAGNINVVGGNNITVSGNAGTNTETFNVTGTTNHAVQVGNASGSLTSLPVGTNGQVLLGNTGANPAFITPIAGTGLTLTTNATTLEYALTIPVTVTDGGTGDTTLTLDGVLIGNGTSPVVVTAAGTTGQVLTGITGSPPAFQSPAASSISITGDSGGALTGNAFTFTGGATGLTLSGAGTTETVIGTLVVAHGGTGATTLTSDSLLLGNGTSPVTPLGVATNGQIPIGNTGNAPTLATITAGTGITVVNGAGSITLTASNTIAFTSVTTTPYVALATDDFLGVTTSSLAISIELPNAPATGRTYTIKDSTGNAATHNITVTTVGGTDLIDGATTFVMNTAYESINVLFDGTNWEIF